MTAAGVPLSRRRPFVRKAAALLCAGVSSLALAHPFTFAKADS